MMLLKANKNNNKKYVNLISTKINKTTLTTTTTTKTNITTTPTATSTILATLATAIQIRKSAKAAAAIHNNDAAKTTTQSKAKVRWSRRAISQRRQRHCWQSASNNNNKREADACSLNRSTTCLRKTTFLWMLLLQLLLSIALPITLGASVDSINGNLTDLGSPEWVFSQPYAALPPFAVIGGHDCDGSPIYVGRAYHEGDTLPAKVIPSKGCAYVAYGGEEHTKTSYELLVGHGYAWVPCFGGSVPPNAVRSGFARNFEPLYVGRGHYENSLCVGKIHPSHGCFYIPFGGQEINLTTHEVLVFQRTDTWVAATLNYTPPGAVVAGHDTDRSVIYVARAMHNGEILSAKFVPSKSSAYVCFGGYEHNKSQFEVLCGHGYVWVSARHHIIPPNAVSTGRSRNGEAAFIRRGHYHDSLTPGIISVNPRCLYIPYGGREILLISFEVLCRN